MAPRRQVQAITPPPAGVHTGAQVLAFVGTNPTDRPKAMWPSDGRVFAHPATVRAVDTLVLGQTLGAAAGYP